MDRLSCFGNRKNGRILREFLPGDQHFDITIRLDWLRSRLNVVRCGGTSPKMGDERHLPHSFFKVENWSDEDSSNERVCGTVWGHSVPLIN